MRRALDLFCGAGGASRGLADAGYEVVGVDLEPQPSYPYRFVQANALELAPCTLAAFDLVWASPPCQHHSAMTRLSGDPESHPDLLDDTRRLLREAGVSYVIENVVGAPLQNPVLLCGAMFDLGVIRHRLFECSFWVAQPLHRKHKGALVTGEYVTVTGNGGVPAWTLKERERRGLPRHRPGEMSLDRWREAMGIDWMTRAELVQAIPPAYAKYLGKWAQKKSERD